MHAALSVLAKGRPATLSRAASRANSILAGASSTRLAAQPPCFLVAGPSISDAPAQLPWAPIDSFDGLGRVRASIGDYESGVSIEAPTSGADGLGVADGPSSSDSGATTTIQAMNRNAREPNKARLDVVDAGAASRVDLHAMAHES